MQDCVWKSLKLTKNSVIYSLGFVGVLQTFYHNYVVEKSVDGGLLMKSWGLLPMK
jgi:hypothetical protein